MGRRRTRVQDLIVRSKMDRDDVFLRLLDIGIEIFGTQYVLTDKDIVNAEMALGLDKENWRGRCEIAKLATRANIKEDEVRDIFIREGILKKRRLNPLHSRSAPKTAL